MLAKLFFALLLLGPFRALAQPSEIDESGLAQKLSNPVADLMSFPLQNNFDFGAGADGDGFRYLLNIQPVIPVGLGEHFVLINRLILPIVATNGAFVGDTSGRAGLGDILYSAFFSGREPLFGALTWGVGPALNLPTSTNAALGFGQFGVGPTVVLLTVQGPVTAGTLFTQVFLFGAGPSGFTFLQPFVAYTLPTATTISVAAEITNVNGSRAWSTPLALQVSQLVPLGKVPFSFGIGPRWYASTFANGPTWGLRATVTMILPR